jgi:hypothetical protein
MVVPASLKEGVLIDGRNEQEDRRRVDFVTLHEFGHLGAKQYLHAASTSEELPIPWFEELGQLDSIAPGFQRWADRLEKDAR